MKKFATGTGLLAVALIATSASAFPGGDSKSYTVEGHIELGGTPFISGGFARLELNIDDHGEIKSFDSVELLGFQHTFAGDLTVTLTHKDSGTSVVIADPAGAAAGSGDILLGDYTFVDGGAALVTGGPGTYGAVGDLSAFEGLDKFGTWSISMTDSFAGSGGGELNGFTLNMTNVPAPGALALIGLAGLGVRRRRH